MKLKKLIPIMILIVLIVPMFMDISKAIDIRAEVKTTQELTGWHYKQLEGKNDDISNVAKDIYRALYDMYKDGTLAKGLEIDLANTYISNSIIQRYKQGATTLTSGMNAAKYAFFADFPEIFYVDFSKVNIRITKDEKENYHANLGAGSNLNYFSEGFTLGQETGIEENIEKAIGEFDEIVGDIIDKKTEKGNMTNEEYAKALIKYAHEKVIKSTNYRTQLDAYEVDSVTGEILPETDNRSYVRTPYGVFVRGNSLCEGYTRAFKTLMDRIKETNEAKN